MQQDKKVIQFVKGSTVLVIANIVLKAINFFFLPLYTNYLNPTELGISDTITTLTSFLFPLLVMGMDSAFSAFFYEEKSKEHQSKVFNTVWYTLFCSSLFPLILIVFSRKLSQFLFETPDYQVLISVALVSVSIQIWLLPFSLLLRMQNRMAAFSAINVVSSLVMIGFNLLFIVGFRWNAYSLVASTFLTHSVQLFMYYFITKEKLQRDKVDAALRKLMLRFSLPLLPTVIAVWILGMSDRLIIKAFLGESSVGIYGIGARFSGVLAIVSNAVYTAYTSFAFNKKDDPDAKKQFRRVISGFFLVMYIICFIVSLFGKEIVLLMTNASYYSAYEILPGILFGQLAYGIFTISSYGISFTKKTVYYFIATVIGAFASVSLNILLIPRIGLIAAGHVNFIGYFLMAAFGYVFSQKVYPCDYGITRILATSVTGYFAIIFAQGASIIFKIFLSIFMISASCIVFVDVLRDFSLLYKALRIKN